jgi:GT2 family glycosyltransferase
MMSIRNAVGLTPMAVTIVNYNTRECLQACLETVQLEKPGEVVVVDNASSDGSVEMAQACYPQVDLHANKTNVGYGAAANQAIASCSARYVLLLNSDTMLERGALQAMSTYLDEHPRAAVVGPRLVGMDGNLQLSCYPFPTPFNLLFVNSIVGRLIRYVPVLRNWHLRTWSHARARVVPWVLGAALAIRPEAFMAVGGFDESFFMYSEEMDLCYRLQAAGWQVHFAPVTTVRHVYGASTKQRRTEMLVQLFTSLRHFYQRHYSKLQLLQLDIILKSFALARWIVDSVRLSIARKACDRALLAENLAAWKQLLLGQYPGRKTMDSAFCSGSEHRRDRAGH